MRTAIPPNGPELSPIEWVCRGHSCTICLTKSYKTPSINSLSFPASTSLRYALARQAATEVWGACLFASPRGGCCSGTLLHPLIPALTHSPGRNDAVRS
jgi:hypothetical protein